MTSPTCILYQSTDASAPVLSGQAGSLVALLEACLVVGYGSGAQATPAGWTRSFNASSDSVFYSGGTNKFYLNVLDNGESAGGTREARCWGYETCSAISTGTGQFPTAVQSATGITIRKSNTSDSTARPWILLATNNTFYLFTLTGDYTSPMCSAFGFGEYNSYKAGGDAYDFFIIGKQIENDATATNERLPWVGTTVSQAATTGHYITRSFTGIGSAVNVSKFTDSSKTQFTSSTVGTNQYITGLNAPDGGLWTCPIFLNQIVSANPSIRGHLMGLWAPINTQPLSHLDTYSGTGSMAGKTFMAVNVANSGQIFIETSSTWT